MKNLIQNTKKNFNLLVGTAAEATGNKVTEDSPSYLKNSKNFEDLFYQTNELYTRLLKFYKDIHKVLAADGKCIELLAKCSNPENDENVGVFEASSVSLLSTFEIDNLKSVDENKPFRDLVLYRRKVHDCEKLKQARREAELLCNRAYLNSNTGAFDPEFSKAQIEFERCDRAFNDTVRNLLTRRDSIFGAVLNSILYASQTSLKDANVCVSKLKVEDTKP
ncbi:hypothetical protein TVAG_192920 [Trichomonas vaginalis G3]|uniref:BAR domain-containing protein n=1 Tax=Trichomonas vaginalis (strain ATCC PRA-98 / G3) TaxID=412133 RepID=A2DH06_TRIV3|nr:hypothetical protein TVAGG3_0341740 [Trichomonas vaginalis G3]EAY20316.1 hypothetical protein TVAG_192920 [Trichomonas vaginalis G3]KAI5530695.1 hypothetical protein TVAGG3_0341740 [Trichomonas vaginalis G3]|eukprot:XP_001581302.1 hypothetical protein [Trichomonas vaginalis G3]